MKTKANHSSAFSPTKPITIVDTVYHVNIATDSRIAELSIYPESAKNHLVEKRTAQAASHPSLEGSSIPPSLEAHSRQSLFQVAVRGLPLNRSWSTGETMRNHPPSSDFALTRCETEKTTSGTLLYIEAKCSQGLLARQTWNCPHTGGGALVTTVITNQSNEPLEIEMLSSFSITGITPFCADDATGRLRLHRFRTAWSNEGRHCDESLESLHLERTWGIGPIFTRFGQTGSLPVRQFFPFAAIEDTAAGVVWAAQIAWHGSWQMEVYRQDDSVSLSGGHGDFERAHWMKRLAPGESIESPTALITCCEGDIELACHRLIQLQQAIATPEPDQEKELPIVFNEWCASWGHPTLDTVRKTAAKLSKTHTRYFVIDDGWAEKPKGVFQYNGDWNTDEVAFPGGLRVATKAIRDAGLIPGIWFEFEVCTDGTKAYHLTDHHLHRHGKVLTVGSRHFWDFRDSFTFEYLREKVIHRLKEGGFGYLKVDYNESIGLGCDGNESLGEGLRQHLLKVREFFVEIRKEVPDIVIENCASGGHRLEPGMVALTSMSSFSDAHETVEIPIIAASLHRVIPPAKNQIWAVLRPDTNEKRFHYLLTSTFLGRMCISGNITESDDATIHRLSQAQEFYQKLAPILLNGFSRLTRSVDESFRYPRGWQALVRESTDNKTCMVVLHTFEEQHNEIPISISLPDGFWTISGEYNAHHTNCDGQSLSLAKRPEDFTGMAWLLTR